MNKHSPFLLFLLVLIFALSTTLWYVGNQPTKTEAETIKDQLWCRAEIQHQLESVEDTALISIDDIMVTYQVCVDNIDEFPRNAFQGTVYEMP